MFRFGAADGPALAVIAGGLILDTGEAERTFLYRCQDRFLAYTGMLGWPSLFLALDDAHVEVYRHAIRDLRIRLARISDRTGLFAKALREPLFLAVDLETLAVKSTRRLRQQVAVEPPPAAIALNQISPTYAKLIDAVARVFAQLGHAVDYQAEAAHAMADLAMAAQAKDGDVAFVAKHCSNVPLHVPTLVVDSAGFDGLATYADVAAALARATGAEEPAAVFVKTARNTTGNLTLRATSATWPAAHDALRKAMAFDALQDPNDLERHVEDLAGEIALAPTLRGAKISRERMRMLKRLQAAHRDGFGILLQPEVAPPTDGSFAGLGFSFSIDAAGVARPFAINGQLYRDSTRKHFLGAYMGPEVDSLIPETLLTKATALAGWHGARGYRGPINFDARRNREGQIVFIHDCNPRLTGVFPTLAVGEALRRQGFTPHRLLTLGYRGEFVWPDLDCAIETLDARGALFTASHPRGAVILPNLARDHGYDVHLLDVEPAEAARWIAPGGAIGATNPGPAAPACIFL